jgi:octaprenyl-diphosphate synthase
LYLESCKESNDFFARLTNEIAQGEVLQLLNCQNSALTEEEYYQVIERKTAVLFQAATQIGGLLSNIDKVQEQALKNYGLHLGNAFQIIDDVLDYQSNAETMGKEVGDDLSEGKTNFDNLAVVTPHLVQFH